MKTEDIKLFHKVVEFGSLTETAKWLDLPKSNISRRIKQLEEDTGIKLFHRHSRNIKLTDSGNKFYQSTLKIISELEQTIGCLQTPEQELKGKLKVMIMPFMMNIGKLVFDFISLHPNVDVEISSSPDEKDLITNDIDIAFRYSKEITQDNVVAREMSKETFGLFASPQYITAHGKPLTLEEMESQALIGYRFSNGQVFDKLFFKNGQYVQPQMHLIVNSVALLIEAAIQHKGYILMSRRAGNIFAQQGLLQLVLPDYAPKHNFSWLLHLPRQFMSSEAKVFLDFILERIDRLQYRDADLQKVLRVPFNPLIDDL
ncbi:LysR family transcriptional regulator [Photobacterium rosenbergii]|uniref:LysR family transcriptional regulator n=1 Tax=Photobacterium rosenbergii TaxID=294936 RepID=A0ABU3ZEV1_9GAMM|nr:LysR family transcriptional regulator [Photobacterium rosenbergii]MDV5168634.1 LysR family transcriptional regulator [Photobacterium rosenbergii]